MNCPRCASDKVVENGHRYGKQSYHCRDCHRQFRENPSPQGYSAGLERKLLEMLAIAAYQEGAISAGKVRELLGMATRARSRCISKRQGCISAL